MKFFKRQHICGGSCVMDADPASVAPLKDRRTMNPTNYNNNQTSELH